MGHYSEVSVRGTLHPVAARLATEASWSEAGRFGYAGELDRRFDGWGRWLARELAIWKRHVTWPSPGGGLFLRLKYTVPDALADDLALLYSAVHEVAVRTEDVLAMSLSGELLERHTRSTDSGIEEKVRARLGTEEEPGPCAYDGRAVGAALRELRAQIGRGPDDGEPPPAGLGGVLSAALASSDRARRGAALWLAAAWSCPLPELQALTASPEPQLRELALDALGRTGPEEPTRARAHALLGDPDPWVRWAAARVLARHEQEWIFDDGWIGAWLGAEPHPVEPGAALMIAARLGHDPWAVVDDHEGFDAGDPLVQRLCRNPP